MSKPSEKAFPAGRRPQTVQGRPRRDEIELRAYQIYLDRGGAHGQDVRDWLQAEDELLEKYGQAGQPVKAGPV